MNLNEAMDAFDANTDPEVIGIHSPYAKYYLFPDEDDDFEDWMMVVKNTNVVLTKTTRFSAVNVRATEWELYRAAKEVSE